MQGIQQKIGKVLNIGSSYRIPAYQRHYEWGPDEWQGLIQDVLRVTTSSNSDPEHWLGILLLTNDETVQFPGNNSANTYSIIDGQQRIVTLYIWLSALAHHAESNKQNINFNLKDLSRLDVQIKDKRALEIVLKGEWLNSEIRSVYEDSSVLDAYYYFRFVLWLGESALLDEQPLKVPKINRFTGNQAIDDYWHQYLNSVKGRELTKSQEVNCQQLLDATLMKLNVYTLIHDPNVDEAQSVIFNTLNGKRVELKPLDHVRNSIFVRLDDPDASEVYESFWKPAEDYLLSVPKSMAPGSAFLYDYLISKKGSEQLKGVGTITKNKGQVFFNRYSQGKKAQELKKLISDDLTVAMHTWPVIMRHTNELKIRGVRHPITKRSLELLTSLKDLSDGPANPLTLYYLQAKVSGKLSSDQELEKILFLIENFLVRKILAREAFSPLRSRIMQICSALDSHYSYDRLEEELVNSGWNSDSQIRKNFVDSELSYKSSQIGAVLRGIERKLSGESALFMELGKNSFTLEHIYPQDEKLWINDLDRWNTTSRRMSKFVNSFGNLTVVHHTHNSAVGNKSLKAKQDYPTVEGHSANLRIHDTWLRAKKWTELEIKERSETLLDSALNYWKDVSDQYE